MNAAAPANTVTSGHETKLPRTLSFRGRPVFQLEYAVSAAAMTIAEIVMAHSMAGRDAASFGRAQASGFPIRLGRIRAGLMLSPGLRAVGRLGPEVGTPPDFQKRTDHCDGEQRPVERQRQQAQRRQPLLA